jgi:hypothetical protein
MNMLASMNDPVPHVAYRFFKSVDALLERPVHRKFCWIAFHPLKKAKEAPSSDETVFKSVCNKIH